MQENFDLNKKSVPGDGYRKNLADRLIGMESEEAQNELVSEQNKEVQYGKNEYEQEKIEQKAQWIISKYLSKPNLIKLNDSLSLEERQSKIDEILSKKIEEIKEKGGVSDKYEESVYKLVTRLVKERDFEENLNLKHFKGEECDITLQKKGKNKFIEIGIRENNMDRDIFFDLGVEYINANPRDMSSETLKSSIKKNPEIILATLKKYISDEFKDEKRQIEFIINGILRSITNNIIIARPMVEKSYKEGVVAVFNQHYEMQNKFEREHKNYIKDSCASDESSNKDASLIFGEAKKEELEIFAKGVLEIIKNEKDYKVALEKLKNLPKPTNIKPSFSVTGGGYMALTPKGKIDAYGSSERYGEFNQEIVKKILKKVVV